MGIRVKTNFSFKELGDELKRSLEAEMGGIIADAADELEERTLSGVDVDGGAFKPYSKGYERKKVVKLKRDRTPNLNLTGNMFTALTSRVERVGDTLKGYIYFSSAKEAQKAEWNQALRRFFGLSGEQENKIMQRFKKALAKL